MRVVPKPPTNTDATIAKHLVKEVTDLLAGRPPSSCLVFVNTPATARAVVQILNAPRCWKELSSPRVVLLTGRMREREAEAARKVVLDPKVGMRAGSHPRERYQHLVVVATQTLEVGADLDAEHLVTEACGVRALTQRLGRLNRLGKHQQPLGVYVHIPPSKGPNPQWRVYGEEPSMVFRRLTADSEGSDTVDLSPARLAEGVLGVPGDNPGRAARVSVGLLHEWVQSSADTPGEAPVEPFFSGLSKPQKSVQIVWRAHLPEVDQRVWPAPTDRESVEVPIWEAEQALADVADDLRRVTPDGTAKAVEIDEHRARLLLRPGWTVIIRSSAGKMDGHGWNPVASESVLDMSVLSHGLPLDIETFRALYPEGGLSVKRETILDAADERQDGEPVNKAGRREAAQQLMTALSATPPTGYDPLEWGELIGDLDSMPRKGQSEVARLQRKRPHFSLGQKQPHRSVRFDAFEELSQGRMVGLRQHGIDAMEFAEGFARALGIDSNTVDVLSRAAQWHDLGKADPRFQLWLRANNPDNGELLAKSDTPRHQWQRFRDRSGWPPGGRHEAISGRLVQAWLNDNRDRFCLKQADLLVHLVVSHHGRGRPLILPVRDRTGTGVKVSFHLDNNNLIVDASLSTVDWQQPARFAQLNHRYGYWGLALLETIVRQADWAASGNGLEIR